MEIVNSTFHLKKRSLESDDYNFLNRSHTNIEIENKSCAENGQFSCRTKSNCFTFSDICYYKLDKLNNIIPCNMGTHLYNCDIFECNMKFKCHRFYCISWSYVCDAKWDCPTGTDELDCGPNRICKNMLKCKGSQICIHLGNTCDGIPDCPKYDDEGLYCQWEIPPCPKACECLISAVKCFNVSHSDTDQIHSQNFPFFAVFIQSSGISETFLKLNIIGNRNMIYSAIYIFDIKENKISEPCHLLKKMEFLVNVDLGYNWVTVLMKECFPNSLQVLKLNYNFLSHISKDTFLNTKLLLYLDLSNNPLESLSEKFNLQQPHLLYLCTIIAYNMEAL